MTHLLGAGDGTFAPGSTTWTGPVVDVRVSDFNGDGRSDLALLPPECDAAQRRTGITGSYCPFFDRILIFIADGGGVLRDPVEVTGIQAPRTLTCCLAGLVVADFNRDGSPDIATSTAILLGKGDGSFQAAQNFVSPNGQNFDSPGYGRYPVVAADFDGDGHLDLVMHTGNEGEGLGAYILFGRGDGTMASSKYPWRAWNGICCGYIDYVYGTSFNLAGSAADLDGDGRPDLITAQWNYVTEGRIIVLLNRTEATPR